MTKVGKNFVCEYCETPFVYYGNHSVRKCCSTDCAVKLITKKRVDISTKMCSACGSVFCGRGHFCSDECRRIHGLKDLTSKDVRDCANCGKEFAAPMYTTTKYCSKACNAAHKRATKVLCKPEDQLNKRKLICAQCGKAYVVWNYRHNSKFCSKECHYASKPRSTLVCKFCGKEFEVQYALRDIQKFCNKECAKQQAQVHRNAYSKAELFIKAHLESLGYKVTPEVRVTHSNGYYVPDIVVGRKIIEYYGTFWHCDPHVYTADYYNKATRMSAQQKWDFDASRIATMQEAGYTILIIWEREFNADKELTLSRCINFLEGKETYA